MPEGQLPISGLPDLPSGESIQFDDLLVLVHGGVTYKLPAGLLFAAVGAGNSQVIDSATIALLEDDANWDSENHYTGTPITTQLSGDFHVNDDYDYKFYIKLGALTARRILYSSSATPPTGDLLLSEGGDTFTTEDGDTFILEA